MRRVARSTPANYVDHVQQRGDDRHAAASAVTANNQAKVYGQPDPALTFTAPTVRAARWRRALPAPGETFRRLAYAITQGTVTNANNPNYSITFVNGQLVITPAPLTIAADKSAPLRRREPAADRDFTGLANGDTAAAIPGVVADDAGGPRRRTSATTRSTWRPARTRTTPSLTFTASSRSRRCCPGSPPTTRRGSSVRLEAGRSPPPRPDSSSDRRWTTPLTERSSSRRRRRRPRRPGVYAIAPGGVSSGNYTITFVERRAGGGAGRAAVGSGARDRGSRRGLTFRLSVAVCRSEVRAVSAPGFP